MTSGRGIMSRQGSGNQARVDIKEKVKVPKETNHRDPAKRAGRIERRARKRAEAVIRKRVRTVAKINAQDHR